MKIIQYFYCSCLLLALSCNDTPTDGNVSEPAAKKAQDDGTAKMVKRLQDSYANINPMQVGYFANGVRADMMKKRLDTTTDPAQQIIGSVRYGYELVNAGRNEAAIRELTAAKQKLDNTTGNEPAKYETDRILAIAYMRLGEQNNCLERGTDESCLIPITEKGIYAVTSSVQAAIGLYEDLLRRNPQDYESIWMLNFAYMTLGQYPDKVPAAYRLSPDFFASDREVPTFRNAAAAAGLNTVGLSGGLAVDDFDNDGNLDVVASSWSLKDQLRIFRNAGDGTFTDVTKAAGIEGLTGGLHLTHADYNNDGYTDILVLRGAWFGPNGKTPNSLLRNNGDGTFTDVTEAAGILTFRPTQTAAWADFNLDGHLDLFIGNESTSKEKFTCEFYLNNGDGTFTDQTTAAGFSNLFGMIKGVTAGDINGDGRADLYVSHLGGSNNLWINNDAGGGKVNFTDVSATAGIQKPVNSFPVWMWDMNNDGRQDIMVGSYTADYSGKASSNSPAAAATQNAAGKEQGYYPHFYRNNNDGTFTEISKQLGTREAIYAMGSNFGDIDNDGYPDAYYGTGAPSFTAIVPNKLYRNNEGKTLEDVTTAAGTGHIQKGHGVGFGDIDNDGDQDIFCVLGGAFEGDVFGDALFVNPYGNEKNQVTLRLEGVTANRSAIGAKIKITVKDKNGKSRDIYHWVNTGGSFGGNSLQAEIGLGEAEMIETLEITWPNAAQTKSVFKNVAVNRFYRIKEDSSSPELLTVKKINLG